MNKEQKIEKLKIESTSLQIAKKHANKQLSLAKDEIKQIKQTMDELMALTQNEKEKTV